MQKDNFTLTLNRTFTCNYDEKKLSVEYGDCELISMYSLKV